MKLCREGAEARGTGILIWAEDWTGYFLETDKDRAEPKILQQLILCLALQKEKEVLVQRTSLASK